MLFYFLNYRILKLNDEPKCIFLVYTKRKYFTTGCNIRHIEGKYIHINRYIDYVLLVITNSHL